MGVEPKLTTALASVKFVATTPSTGARSSNTLSAIRHYWVGL
jgi:hypothetical protein